MSIHAIIAGIETITDLSGLRSNMRTDWLPELVQAFSQYIVAASCEQFHAPRYGF